MMESNARWYLSFATEDEFLGAVIVDADNVIDATIKAHTLGINPGGEVLGYNITNAPVDVSKYMDRLLTLEEAEDMLDK